MALEMYDESDGSALHFLPIILTKLYFSFVGL